MKAKIIIDGKECEILLTEDQKTEIEKISKKRVKKWEDLAHIQGFYIDACSRIDKYGGNNPISSNRNTFATQNQAKGVLAMAQLSQLMKDVNGEWKADWESVENRFCIEYKAGIIHKVTRCSTAQFLAFPTAEIRNQFLENHKELIKTYFLIYH